MPTVYDELVGKMAPVRVDTLAKELQRLSAVTHQYTDMNLELFPPEVLMHMFQYLDEISLWSIGQVCSRWREILFMCVKFERWKDFIRLRWPLLPIDNYDQDWYELYTAMMLSSCCLKCVKQMAAQKLPPHWEESSWRRHRLRTEIKAMRNDPLDGIEAMPLDVNCCHWQATIEGPAGSPYEGGLFFLYIQVPRSYPLDPPIVRFITKIFHPNVSRHGDIGIDSIHHNWSLALTISKLLISIQSLLTDPFCDVCMEPEIGNMYLKNRKAFEEQAKLWTAHHAMHDMLPH
jgi:ubiquitin-protein ligase